MNPDAFDSYPEMLNAEQLAKMLGISLSLIHISEPTRP